MARNLGLQGILARTDAPPAESGEPGDDQADGKTTRRSRGLRPTMPRKVRGLKAGEKARGCKLTIRESVFERLRQTAIKRKKTMSELAGEILHRNLPYFDVIQRDAPPDEAGEAAVR